MTRRGESGIGLVELVIGIAIVGMILSTTGMTLVSILKTTTQTQDQLSATHQLRTGFFWLNQDTQSGVASLATVTAGDVTMQWTDYSTGTAYSSRFQQVGDELRRTITVGGTPSTHVVARNLVAGSFIAVQSGNNVEYSLTVQQGGGTQSRSETSTMRVDDLPATPFPTVTSSPTPTFTPTATPTDTSTPTPTFTPASCTNSSTGYLSPSSNVADTGGSGDGFELTPANAYADAGGFTTNNGGDGDRHRYYTYGINLPAGCDVIGIALRLDYWLKNTGGVNSIDAQLSWDGGTTWTSAKTDASEPTSETTVILGSSSDTWGRSWTAAELSDANLRARVRMNLGNAGQEVYLDWIPINVYYAPPPTSTPTPTDTPTPTSTPSNTPTPTDTPTATATSTQTDTPTITNTPTVTNTSTPTATNTATPTAPAGAWFATGSYTGNGADNRNITGVGFQPDIVIIRYDVDTAPVIRTSSMPADRSKRITSNASLVSNYIQSFQADGFQVGSDANVNNSGRLYHWTAMKAGTNVQVGTYTGNAVDNRNITGVGFQPDWVMTMADNEQDVFRPGPVSGDASFLMNGGSAITNRIQSILADGFQVGSNSDVNQSGRAYYWIAFDATTKVSVSSYTGNGLDNRNITGLGIAPDFVWVKRSASSEGIWRTDTVSGDRTLYWDAGGAVTNRIQSLLADGFQVGTHAEVNNNGSTYYYLALTP